MTQVKAVLLVNLHGEAGRCSHCAQYFDWDVRHSCGAIIDGVVINGKIAANPTRSQVQSVMWRLPSRWGKLLGVGIIERANDGWRFTLLKTTEQLMSDA